VRIIVINETIGTVPIIFPGAVLVGDNPALSGIGLVFNSAAPVASPGAGVGGLIPESNIRLLGPRQRCVERWSIPVTQLVSVGVTANSTVKAYYRNNSAGATGGPIFNDTGLWVGTVESASVPLRVAAPTAQ
jgi:hypothetical protein